MREARMFSKNDGTATATTEPPSANARASCTGVRERTAATLSTG